MSLDFRAYISNFDKKVWILGLIGSGMILVGLVKELGRSGMLAVSSGQGLVIDVNSSSVLGETDSTANSESQFLMVDVGGAVTKPGVYKLSPSLRVIDALESAGGLRTDANEAWVEKSLNRAEVLRDGMKIYIPFAAENVAVGSVANLSSDNESSMISINFATQAQLETLPGIGPVTAKKIVDGRPYSSVEELRTKKVVGQKLYSDLFERFSL